MTRVIISKYQEEDKLSQEILLGGLQNVIQARGGFEKLNQAIGLDKKGLKAAVFENGSLHLDTLIKILRVLGCEINLTAEHALGL